MVSCGTIVTVSVGEESKEGLEEYFSEFIEKILLLKVVKKKT